jgi:hypothetical protein
MGTKRSFSLSLFGKVLSNTAEKTSDSRKNYLTAVQTSESETHQRHSVCEHSFFYEFIGRVLLKFEKYLHHF